MDDPYKVADCQFRDGSVSVEWQSHPDEGTPKAVLGCYASLREARAEHPDAATVCPDCDVEQSPNNHGFAVHREGCRTKLKDWSVESALERKDDEETDEETDGLLAWIMEIEGHLGTEPGYLQNSWKEFRRNLESKSDEA